jgi:hypothetical protein
MITAAEYRGLISYKQVARILGIHTTGNHMGREVGQVLGEICEEENCFGRPMLSAVAVSTSGMPSDGFFVQARKMNKPFNSKQQFWKAELRRVYAAWQPKLNRQPK